MLRISRYTERERWNFIKGVVLGHREMLEEIVKGERTSLYRDRKEIERAKDLKGGLSAASWFLGGQVKSTISC